MSKKGREAREAARNEITIGSQNGSQVVLTKARQILEQAREPLLRLLGAERVRGIDFGALKPQIEFALKGNPGGPSLVEALKTDFNSMTPDRAELAVNTAIDRSVLSLANLLEGQEHQSSGVETANLTPAQVLERKISELETTLVGLASEKADDIHSDAEALRRLVSALPDKPQTFQITRIQGAIEKFEKRFTKKQKENKYPKRSEAEAEVEVGAEESV